MGTTVVTAPSVPALSLAEAKLHLRVPGSDQDALITSLVAAAERHLFRLHGLVLTSATHDVTPLDDDGEELDGFPAGRADIIMPLHPLQSVTQINYQDPDGDGNVWASSNYVVDAARAPGRIRLAYDTSYPATRKEPGAVVIQAVFGYGDDAEDVPETLRHAIRLLIGHWYENRESVVVGVTPKPIEQAFEMLVRDEAVLELS